MRPMVFVTALISPFFMFASCASTAGGDQSVVAPQESWCEEHGVPEARCERCNPALAHPPTPRGADVRELSRAGEDVPALEPHAVPGKITVFDFYAAWCQPCQQLDAHVVALLGQRSDVALRKLNVVSWDTPLAARYLARAPTLPLVVVYGRDGTKIDSITGLDLAALDAAIEKASGR